jgi:hypothetical protein
MRIRIALACAALVAAFTAGLSAYADEGHRIVGRLAELHLRDTRALQEVRKILRHGETLADAAVWPDTIKRATYEDEDTAPFRLEHIAHDTYHFASLPFQVDRYDLSVPGARDRDIVQMLRESIRVLRGMSKFFTPREALRLVAHFVGDIHQPLHIGTGFVSSQGPLRFVVPQGTTGWRPSLGGNALLYGPQDRFNLHSYWDAHAVNITMRRDDEATFVARLFEALPVMPAWKDSGNVDEWPQHWADEALLNSKPAHDGIAIVAYLGPDDSGRTAHRWRIQLPAGYDERARALTRVQLAKGGYRLAALLKAIWPDR